MPEVEPQKQQGKDENIENVIDMQHNKMLIWQEQ